MFLLPFTPDEIWQLIVICEGDKVFNQNAMRQYRKGSKAYNEYKELCWAEKMQKLLRSEITVLEEV